MKYPVVNYDTPVLRKKAAEVTEFGQELALLGGHMVETMHAYNGIGLAAQQIGKTISICVVDLPAEHDVDEEKQRLNPDIEMPMVLVNPVVSEPSVETDGYEEGCLSFPGINGKVIRPLSVRVQYQTPTGEKRDIRTQGLLARVIQHEVDHLNGVLFIDHMSPLKRKMLKKKLRTLKEETAAAKRAAASLESGKAVPE